MEDEMFKKLFKLKENLLYDFRSIKQKNIAVMNYINDMIETALIESNMSDIVVDIKAPMCMGDSVINYTFDVNKKNILKDEFIYDVVIRQTKSTEIDFSNLNYCKNKHLELPIRYLFVTSNKAIKNQYQVTYRFKVELPKKLLLARLEDLIDSVITKTNSVENDLGDFQLKRENHIYTICLKAISEESDHYRLLETIDEVIRATIPSFKFLGVEDTIDLLDIKIHRSFMSHEPRFSYYLSVRDISDDKIIKLMNRRIFSIERNRNKCSFYISQQ